MGYDTVARQAWQVLQPLLVIGAFFSSTWFVYEELGEDWTFVDVSGGQPDAPQPARGAQFLTHATPLPLSLPAPALFSPSPLHRPAAPPLGVRRPPRRTRSPCTSPRRP